MISQYVHLDNQRVILPVISFSNITTTLYVTIKHATDSAKTLDMFSCLFFLNSKCHNSLNVPYKVVEIFILVDK